MSSSLSTTSFLTVTELTRAIKKNLEPTFSNVTLKGEITNLKKQSSGHIYFQLKDENAQISAVLFKGNAAKLSQSPKSGDNVIVKGELSIYAPRGSYQIIVRSLQQDGIGEYLLKLHQLKLLCQKRGWFDEKHKKKLPKYPQTIGVVTSPTGSVIQDIIHVLKRRSAPFTLILYPVAVQGEFAAKEIATAIDEMNRYNLCDCMIVGRGGGSLEDLFPFNEEIVAQSIFSSKIPIVSAVGHETDFSIADYVADVRAPTPSAGAEIVCIEKTAQLSFLSEIRKKSSMILLQKIKLYRSILDRSERHPLMSDIDTLLSPYMQKIDEAKMVINHRAQSIIRENSLKLSTLKKRLQDLSPIAKCAYHREKQAGFLQNMENRIQEKIIQKRSNLEKISIMLHNRTHYLLQEKRAGFDASKLYQNLQSRYLSLVLHKKQKFTQMQKHLESIDPKNLLQKGYSIITSKQSGKAIKSANDLAVGAEISFLLIDGKADARIETIREN